MVEKNNSQPLAACLGSLTYRSAQRKLPHSQQNKLRVTDCAVQHNPWAMAPINPSAPPFLLGQPCFAGRRTRQRPTPHGSGAGDAILTAEQQPSCPRGTSGPG